MTINDLLNAGIAIQGAVCVKSWSDEAEKYNILLETDSFESAHAGNYRTKHIKYMYSIDGVFTIEIE